MLISLHRQSETLMSARTSAVGNSSRHPWSLMENMTEISQVITRFAPSPTGFLHIGGARTALFNWLFARHHNGQFLLRIEDTDRARSTQEAIDAILDGMSWLGLSHDGEAVYQSTRQQRHAEIADQLLREGKAYYCYCTPEELDEMRSAAREAGKPVRYNGLWRDRDPSDAPQDIPPVVRLKAPQTGETTIRDQVLGDITFANDQLDDLILLRSDGTPTYMLSVVVDDHDMGITHVIRGDDHLTNAARQAHIYGALGWDLPIFAHVPMILGPDGAKLSKRHGALGVGAYRDMGYLPEAMRNYLLRLGWSHGDDEIISTAQAIAWFTLENIGKSPARFDFAKLENLNGIYMRDAAPESLMPQVVATIAQIYGEHPDAAALSRLEHALPGLKERATNLVELAENAHYLFAERPLKPDEKAAKLLNQEACAHLQELADQLEALAEWTAQSTEDCIRAFIAQKELKLGKVAQPLRAALTGTTVSPGIFDVLVSLGKEESLARLRDQAA